MTAQTSRRQEPGFLSLMLSLALPAATAKANVNQDAHLGGANSQRRPEESGQVGWAGALGQHNLLPSLPPPVLLQTMPFQGVSAF